MFCSRCGKKVLDEMQFCPFCGTKIIIPDQEEDAATPVKAESIFDAPAGEPATPRASKEMPELSAAARRFVEERTPVVEAEKPMEDAPAAETEKEASEPTKPEEKKEDSFWAKPSENDETPEKAAKPIKASPREELRVRPKPVKAPEKPLDMFLENEEEEDAFDAFEAVQSRARDDFSSRNYGSRYRDEELDDDDDDDGEGFFARHIRGIVAFVLVLALLAAVVVYGISDPGQMLLAKLNLPFALPLKAEAYVKLGYERYQQEDYAQAGAYYEKALTRQPDNYNYASSAAMAYVADKDTIKATEMLKKCVEINPDALEPYIYLMNLYPDSASRPGEITRLLEQGYQRTNDERLKLQ